MNELWVRNEKNGREKQADGRAEEILSAGLCYIHSKLMQERNYLLREYGCQRLLRSSLMVVSAGGGGDSPRRWLAKGPQQGSFVGDASMALHIAIAC